MTTLADQAGQRAAASAAVHRASQIVLARQGADGWWSGRPSGAATLAAEGLLVREFLGLRTPELTSAVAQQIRSEQQTDGSWADGDLPGSVLAYLSLRLAGDSADAYHMACAAGWIRDAGGIAATTPATRAWLAMFGLTGWAEVCVPAPEVIFLPARYWPGNADWASWSRQALVSLAVIAAVRPYRQLSFDVRELRASGQDAGGPDRRLRFRPRPLSAARSAAEAVALRSCGQSIIDWQQRDGLPAWQRPAWPCSLVALHSLGYPTWHPVLAHGLDWLDAVTGPARRAMPGPGPTARQPPVGCTTLAIEALADAGLPGTHPALVAAAGWLLAQRIEGPADGHAPKPGPAPSGWCFGTDGYPAVADTASVLTALSRVDLSVLPSQPAIGNATRWLTGVQGRDGSWGGSALVTGQVLRALAAHCQPDARPVRRAAVRLLQAQLTDGSWSVRSGEGDLRTTATVLIALLSAGVVPTKPAIRTAVDWLLARQNLNAGWASGSDSAPRGRASTSDPVGTAWALAALLAAGGNQVTDSVDLGVDWLIRAQQADGGWSEGPLGRNPHQRKDALLLPTLLPPLGALGRYAADGRG